MPPRLARLVDLVLVLAVAIDVALGVAPFVRPDTWFHVLHHATGTAIEIAFLRRCAAQWLTFAGLQLLALARWRRWSGWLLIVAGARFADLLTDWTYLASSPVRTPAAWPLLIAPGLLNLGMGALLVVAYRRQSRARAATRP